VSTSAVPGFYGKLPSRGDFVTRRVAADFVRVWDDWLQSGIAASRAALGDTWLEIYLTSPIWRFALAPGICGADGHVGVVIPSVDRVGRYFPLAAAAPCGRTPAVLAYAAQLDDWYADVENLLLATLAESPLDVDALDERLARLSLVLPGGAGDDTVVTAAQGVPRRHYRVAQTNRLRDVLMPPLAELLASELGTYAAWWTQGSERIEPCVLIDGELPAADAFVAMLDGRWSDRGWASMSFGAAAQSADRPAALVLRSAAVTDAGKARATNEDACARRDDVGAYVVADGLGGHRSGETASRMVARVLEQPADPRGLSTRVEQLIAGLRAVNGCLRVLAERDGADVLSASTVAALLVDGSEWACVWAGDSRVYRLRDGVLEQLSRDHTDEADEHSVTRAVGGADDLELDIVRGDARAGDCFLLCTDGVYRALTRDEIAAALLAQDPTEACATLKRAVLDGDASDNLTAVVVRVDAALKEEIRA